MARRYTMPPTRVSAPLAGVGQAAEIAQVMLGWVVPSPDPRGAKLAEIDALRGVAIALVVAFHADALVARRSVGAAIDASPAGAFVYGGHTGVSLFFVLSGFLLARPFVAEALGDAAVSRRRYAARRALRILPAYVLAVVVASVACADRLAEVLRGAPYLVFLNSVPALVTPLEPYSGVWWSLATEVQFYLLLPWLPRLWRARARPWLPAALVLAWAGVYALGATGHLRWLTMAGTVALFGSLFGRAPLFALGAWAAWVLPGLQQTLASWRGWPRRLVPDLALAVLLVALGLLLQRVVATSYLGAELAWQWWHLLEGALWAGVLLVLLAARPWTRPLVCNPIVCRLGVWSYSLYLVHFPLLWHVLNRHGSLRPVLDAWGLPASARLPAALAACVALAASAHLLVERPFLRLKDRES